jgi:hypothetical protein
MNQMRKDDLRPHTKFRASRYYTQAGGWFFRTREGSAQGPFDSRLDAQYALNTYTRVFSDLDFHSHLLAGGLCKAVNKLTLVPIQMQWR